MARGKRGRERERKKFIKSHNYSTHNQTTDNNNNNNKWQAARFRFDEADDRLSYQTSFVDLERLSCENNCLACNDGAITVMAGGRPNRGGLV